ncbi:branched-chain amino acid ABC transporter permease [Burkholderia gladioli pv. gladioli]|uniref:Branched-chain amino acid ABC transporter permease n=1 Tax=Burkholderia gladioli TaxID=28095 RepID=A0A095HB70_BURGA|nr:branched-chain amino acid ABC transporter permease [Burkholderia gladioli]AJW98813.1 branched-chain amino acid transport system / permease component family protein [Burkholderia gladioli]ASD79925.1 branched-chain amino acid ABC transporter permease [Burkholderia gladioli pv. gladioli]AWY54833.1 branched-chain amino acid ABC transporter permease [Burkholderia gladioli pv. gladioli]KGC10864.1 branched-chain amino acid transport system / permease component family protein [Burkholderia gladioli]
MGNFLLEQIVNGVVAGSVYALIAAGMTMIFGVLRAINFAHGEYYMIGTFAAWYVISKLGIDYGASIVIAVAVSALIAALIGRLVMQRLVNAPFQSGVLATLGISLVLQNAVILAFGGGYKVFPGGWLDPVELFGIGMAQQRVVLVVASLVMFAGLEWMVRRTRMGKSIRAVSQNPECCQVIGIDVEKVVRQTFILGTALAAFSGALTGPVNVSVYGGMGETITLKTFAVIVMGGMGNVRGTLFAGWMLGIAESLVAGSIGLEYRDSVGFIALLLMLMFRPMGLFAPKARF